ncbi:MAG TPA: type IV pilin protein [Casimicrobiaceae bacterium]|jgi:type IV pilus assembly protein PilE
MTQSRTRGFTLIEMMVVVAVVGVLAAIAYPSYQQYLKRSSRTAAQTFMMDLSNRQQQYLLDQRVYAGATTCTAAGVATLGVATVPPEVSANYDICIIQAAGPPPTFRIDAVPKAGTIMAGDGTLSLDQAGAKSPPSKWEGR